MEGGGAGGAKPAPGTNNYWAKGTGFGTGSTISSWDAEQALLRQKSEEQHVACLLQVCVQTFYAFEGICVNMLVFSP